MASFLVPKAMRQGLAAVYAIARLGDDVADEGMSIATTTKPPSPISRTPLSQSERLADLAQLDAIVSFDAGHDNHPVFMAVQDTITRHHLPSAPFHRLFEAFRRDVQLSMNGNELLFSQWQQVLEYCDYSANPVGELMLRLSADWTDGAKPLSDAICSALQITNFLQDLTVDVPRKRRYIPGMPADVHTNYAEAVATLTEARSYTATLFDKGQGITHIPRSWRLRLELKAIIAGGRMMLSRCDERVLARRRTLTS
ncbi:MAG: squalene/phytoene synthase family protein [Bradyrhizobiaceae bacterium]|nr:squalene/phytoene synthase family protein [Bradyrhizobiaceae bacterium]